MIMDKMFENVPKCLSSEATLTKLKSIQTFHIRFLQSKQKPQCIAEKSAFHIPQESCMKKTSNCVQNEVQ